jgi:hypothetical protein
MSETYTNLFISILNEKINKDLSNIVKNPTFLVNDDILHDMSLVCFATSKR